MYLRSASALLACALAAGGAARATDASSGKQIEYLNRGAVAIKSSNGVFVSWRQLASDAPGMLFNVYRDGVRLNAAPLDALNYSDPAGTASNSYAVREVVGGVERPGYSAGATWASYFMTIPVQAPPGGSEGGGYTYELNDGAPADLDGDGTYELIVKWQPTNYKDNSQGGITGKTYLDAYKMDGTRLWRIDLGRNIRAGSHYTTFVAYDLDGDGKAEVMMKTADGTVDGAGAVIGDANADYRNQYGYILSGPEYLTVFNGMTGAAMKTVDYLPARGNVAAWGDTYGNRVDRFLGGVANLDGNRPSAIFSRGYYTRAVIAAWDWRDGELTSRWVFDTDVEGAAARGQGAHWFATGDVDDDGKDDIVYGAATISSEGKLLYASGRGHGDALHFGDLDPNHPGKEIYMVHEDPGSYGPYGSDFRDAATGALLWGVSGANSDVGRGVCFDVLASSPGEECWSSRGGLRSATGANLGTAPGYTNFAVWWDGDLLREVMGSVSVQKLGFENGAVTVTPLMNSASLGTAANNSTKATPVLTADLFGDWREEIVLRNTSNTALYVFSTTIPSSTRITTLMHDPQYRAQVAEQNAGYNQPPHPSFYLGEGATSFAQEPVHLAYDGTGTFQAEAATGAGGVSAKAAIAGYQGSGYAAFPSSGGSLQFDRIGGGDGGAKAVTIRYANGNPTPRTGVLKVNGVAQPITFRITGGAWATMTAQVHLMAGVTNTLRFESTGQGLGNIDEITVQ